MHGVTSIQASDTCGLCDVITPVLFVVSVPAVVPVAQQCAQASSASKEFPTQHAYGDRDARGPPATYRVTLA